MNMASRMSAAWCRWWRLFLGRCLTLVTGGKPCISVVFALLSVSSCQLLIDADFDQDYVVCKANCAGLGFACGTYTDACGNTHDCGQCSPDRNCESNQCVCVAQDCDELGYECGAFVDTCGQPRDCGACPPGQACGGSDGHTCSTSACDLQSCAELGLASGLDQQCGLLISCDPSPECVGCGANQVCTPMGCCTPRPPPSGACGYLPNGCGQLDLVTCPGDQVCEDGRCCEPDFACGPDAVCGLNPTGCASVWKECEGACANGAACTRPNEFGNWSCGECERACPAQASCGADNDDGCEGKIVCAGSCPTDEGKCFTACPAGEDCLAAPFQCCLPRCPPTPQACGSNPDGCGGQIDCPGPCPSGSTCTRTSDAVGSATFECL